MPVDAPNLQLAVYPDPVLRKKAAPVKEINREVRAVAERMFEVMAEEEGIGLAAPQVGLSWRMFVLHVPENEERSASADPPTASHGRMVFINPKLTQPTGAVEPETEGCLSLPDISGEVRRAPVITVTAQDEHGKTFTLTTGGLLARCIQHENDHLDGVLILDRMSQMSRIKNRAAIKDLEADA